MQISKLILILGLFANNLLANNQLCIFSHRENITVTQSSLVLDTTPPYKVIRIIDGDTFEVLIDSMSQKVRFTHIDTPERKQPFYKVAKQFVSDLCFGRYVRLIYNPANMYDRYGRLLAEISLEDGRILNKEIIKNGLAWHFKKYSDSKEYAELENQAREAKLGLWLDPNPIPPWMDRNKK
jgi:micrococcal nuclease